MNYFILAQAALISLKLMRLLEWEWGLVFLPFWTWIACVIFYMAYVALVLTLTSIRDFLIGR